MFENRRNLDITRPRIKDSVMTKLKNGLAGPAFLIQLKSDHREIDKYMAKYKKDKSPRKVRDFTLSQMSMTSKTPFLSALKPKKKKFFNQTSEKVRDIINFDKEMQENSDLFASTILPAGSTDAGGTFMANTTSRGPNAFATLSTMRGSIGKFQDADEIPKPSPFLPAHFKQLNMDPIKPVEG